MFNVTEIISVAEIILNNFRCGYMRNKTLKLFQDNFISHVTTALTN